MRTASQTWFHRLIVAVGMIVVGAPSVAGAQVKLGVEWEFPSVGVHGGSAALPKKKHLLCTTEEVRDQPGDDDIPLFAITWDNQWRDHPKTATLELITGPIPYSELRTWGRVADMVEELFDVIEKVCEPRVVEMKSGVNEKVCFVSIAKLATSLKKTGGLTTCGQSHAPALGLFLRYDELELPKPIEVGRLSKMTTQVNLAVPLASFADPSDDFSHLFDDTGAMQFKALRQIREVLSKIKHTRHTAGFLAMYYLLVNGYGYYISIADSIFEMKDLKTHSTKTNKSPEALLTVQRDVGYSDMAAIKNAFGVLPKISLPALYRAMSVNEQQIVADLLSKPDPRFCLKDHLTTGIDVCAAMQAVWGPMIVRGEDPISLDVISNPVTVTPDRKGQGLRVLVELRGDPPLVNNMYVRRGLVLDDFGVHVPVFLR